ncbi:MAG: pilus assembly protein [Myxococcales bacterium]|nr:pilus assembly protein [Myxococcales bacterium]
MYVEFLVVFMPVFFLFLGMIQVSMMFSAKLVVQHAADAAARSAIVVIPDDPGHYGGVDKSPKNQIDFADSSADSGGIIDRGLGFVESLGTGMSVTRRFSTKGGPRLNAIRLAAYKPLMAVAPSPSQVVSAGGAPSVRQAIGGAGARFAGGILYNLTAVAVTFPTAPEATGVQTEGTQSFPVSRTSPANLTARVTYLFHCAVPGAARLMCYNPLQLGSRDPEAFHELDAAMFPGAIAGYGALRGCFYPMRAESTLLYQGADYQFRSEDSSAPAAGSPGSGSGGIGG